MMRLWKGLAAVGLVLVVCAVAFGEVPLDRRFAHADRLQKEGLLDDAIEAYKEAASFTDDSEMKARAHCEMGSCLKKKRKYQDALVHYMKVFEVYRGTRRADALYEMAKLYRDCLRKPALAAESLDQVARLFPKHERASDALYESGQIKESRKEYEGAIEIYNRNVDTYPKSPAAELSLACVAEITYKRQNRPLDAVKVWEKFARMYPESLVPALYNAAQILEKQKQFKGAIEAYKAFMDAHPDHKLTPNARKRHDSLLAKYGK